jgi:hypothetical protein
VAEEDLSDLPDVCRTADPPLDFPTAVVERTFGWFNRYRRLSKDYELLPQTSEAVIQVTMIHLMIRPLARIAPY